MAITITVSIVEDDAPSRRIFADWINRADGFCCLGHHGNGHDAIIHLPLEKPSIALMDINLPGLTGIECVKQLKPLLPQTQFVMLTVYEDADHIFNALAAGASGYLLKETPRQDLLAALKDVHAGGSPMTSNIARKVVQTFQSLHPYAPASDNLSPREHEVLELLARGYLYKEISDKLNLSVPTICTYIRRIYEKLHVHSRSQAVAKFKNFQDLVNTQAIKH